MQKAHSECCGVVVVDFCWLALAIDVVAVPVVSVVCSCHQTKLLLLFILIFFLHWCLACTVVVVVVDVFPMTLCCFYYRNCLQLVQIAKC